MSFILDALKKAERERTLGVSPGASALSHPDPGQKPKSGHPALYALIGALTMAVLALGGLFWYSHTPFGGETAPLPATPPPSPLPIPMPPATPATPSSPPMVASAPAVAPTPPPTQSAPASMAPTPPSAPTVAIAPPTPALSSPPPPPVVVQDPSLELPEAALVTVDVEAVLEGCRLKVRFQGKVHTAILGDVACPETTSPWWSGAKDFMEKSVVGRGGILNTRREEDRVVIDIYTAEGPLLNRELVRAGWAVAVGGRFQPLEAEARRQGVGMWRAPGP